MAKYIIWLDSEHASIFDLKVSGIEKSQLQRQVIDHHTTNKKDHHGDPATEHFYRDLAKRIKDAEEILLLGPSLSKNHFKTYLESHTPGLAKAIVGIEATDHPTDNQIMAIGRKFFKTYNLFHHPI